MANMRILLAEDEHALGELLSKALEQSGYWVDWLDDGRLVACADGKKAGLRHSMAHFARCVHGSRRD